MASSRKCCNDKGNEVFRVDRSGKSENVCEIVDFAELFSSTGRSSIVECVLAGFRLKDGAKVAEATVS